MLIKVKVFPNSKKESVKQKGKDAFEVEVRQKPREGKANEAVFLALSKFSGVPKNKIKLIRGAKTRNKIFDIKT